MKLILTMEVLYDDIEKVRDSLEQVFENIEYQNKSDLEKSSYDDGKNVVRVEVDNLKQLYDLTDSVRPDYYVVLREEAHYTDVTLSPWFE